MKLINLASTLLVTVVMFGVSGCSDIYWRSEKYVLMGVNGPDQMAFGFETETGLAFYLVNPSVFAVGIDERYAVLKQHPYDERASRLDRGITNYYVIGLTTSTYANDRKKLVRGPMTAEEFSRLRKQLSLPEFTKTFKEYE